MSRSLQDLPPEVADGLHRRADADLLLRSGVGAALLPVLLVLFATTTKYLAVHPTLYWVAVSAVGVSVTVRVTLITVRRAFAQRPRWHLLVPFLSGQLLSTAAFSLLFVSALNTFGFATWAVVLLCIQVVGLATASTISFTPNFVILSTNCLILLGPAVLYGLITRSSEGAAFAFSTLILLIFLLVQGRRLSRIYWELLIDRAQEASRLLELQQAKDAVEEAHRESQYQASHDALTAVLNRRAVLSSLEVEVHRASGASDSLSVLMLDIDHFKSINDTYGHLVGDQVLRSVVERIKLSLRSNDVIGRYGGEEFLLILPQCGPDQIGKVSERLRLSVASKPILAGNLQIPVTVSIGAVFTPPNLAPDINLLSIADQALYQAKHAGRNRVVTSYQN